MSEHDAVLPAPRAAGRRLQQCDVCDAPFVEPEALLGVCEEGLVVALRCGNCERRELVVTDPAGFEQLDRDLDAAQDALVADLVTLDLAAAEADFERFIAALHAGAVLPEDFAAA